MADDPVNLGEVSRALSEFRADMKERFDALDRRLEGLAERARLTEVKVAVLEERSPGKIASVAGLIGGAIAGALTWLSGK